MKTSNKTYIYKVIKKQMNAWAELDVQPSSGQIKVEQEP